MRIDRLDLAGCVLITPRAFTDDRGQFFESYSQRAFAEAIGDVTFIQDNSALSHKRGTLRGLHFQLPPMAQSKLVRVLTGSVLDVAVDIRSGSPTFGQYIAAKLSEENRAQLFVPRGFAHGYLTLEDNTQVAYKVDSYYSPEHERSVLWSDPALAVDWGLGGEAPIIADKDAKAPLLANILDTLPKAAWS